MDKFPEAFERFEKSDIDISDVRDSNDLIRKFRYWIMRGTTTKQDRALIIEAKKRGIPIGQLRLAPKYDVPLEEKPLPVKRHYTFHSVRGIKRTVARIPKGQEGAGRFVKRT